MLKSDYLSSELNLLWHLLVYAGVSSKTHKKSEEIIFFKVNQRGHRNKYVLYICS